MQARGRFIVLEGLDRSGKTTQTTMLKEHLDSSGHAVKLMRFPNRETGTGKLINQYLAEGAKLSDQAIHLLFATN